MNMLKTKNDVITYTINKAIHNDFYISIENGEVVVKAPWYFSHSQIQNIVAKKKEWILHKLKEYEALATRKKENIKKKTIEILGKTYLLKIGYKNVKVPALIVDNKEVKITLPTKYKKADKQDILQLLIEKMYFKLAEQEVERSMEKTRIMLGFAPEDYCLARMKDTLGVCHENKNIMIHPDIVMYDREIIDYVVLHEFCHLHYKIHAKGFTNMLKTYMPNYQKIEGKINHLQY